MLQVIDVGTNSVRSIVVEVPVDGPYRVIDDEREMTRLGEGMEATDSLSSEAMDRTVCALQTMTGIGRRLGVRQVRAIGTEALRRAHNAGALLSRATAEAGLDIEVVSPEEEGRLVWISAALLSRGAGLDIALDTGGGSVEVVQAVDGETVAISSMPLGARVLAERFVHQDPIDDASFKLMKKYVKRVIREQITPLGSATSPVIGSGGTVNSIGWVTTSVAGCKHTSLHGIEVGRAEIMQLLSVLSRSTIAGRLKLPGLSPDRVDIIMPGAVVLAEVLKLFGASGIVVNARGIREGIVIDTLAREGAIDTKPDLMRSVRDLGTRYHYDRAHGERVTMLALSMFDQVAEPLGLDLATRPLLEAAAMLHDIGYYIACDRHHEHSYHLITHSPLPMLTRREQAVVAAIARYHTKALPKQRHAAWASLETVDRPVVRSLAAILRLADGLDRGRAGRVDSVRAELSDDRLGLFIRGREDVSTEAQAVGKKRDLFEETFGREVTVEQELERSASGSM
jgi:exopolyphosphatase/guanosine-5'-triphosphate,3'-diphosphate pyrophosphatase